MKHLFITLLVSIASVAYAAGEKKEVCNEKKDSKGNVVKRADGKPVMECKTITVHKKVEGEKVPEKK
jgi:hypothetical protein